MVKFYVVKIQDNEINPNTELPWTVEDVPKLWRAKVDAELKNRKREVYEENGQNI